MESFNFELAERFCTRAVELSPDNLQALNMAASVYLEIGKVNEAVGVSFLQEFRLCCQLVC
jgi:Flp pilus assembly protein TadD